MNNIITRHAGTLSACLQVLQTPEAKQELMEYIEATATSLFTQRGTLEHIGLVKAYELGAKGVISWLEGVTYVAPKGDTEA